MWRLLASSLRARRGYSIIIITAVALGLACVMASLLSAAGIGESLASRQLMLGPELAVVPPGTRENGQIYLTKGPPAGHVPAAYLPKVKNFPEITAASPQMNIGALDGGAALIAYDPDTDFMIIPWLEKADAASRKGAILGANVKGKEEINHNGRSWVVTGRLRPSGSFMDDAVFIPMPEDDMKEPSWILLALDPGASVDIMINKIQTNLKDIEVIARPEMLKTINSQLANVSDGSALNSTAALVAIAAFLLMTALMTLLIYEQRRDFALFKAMGAKNGFVFTFAIGEAAALGVIGALIGCLLFGVFAFASGFAGALGGDLTWKLPLCAVACVALCVVAAFVPACFAATREPYAAIRGAQG